MMKNVVNFDESSTMEVVTLELPEGKTKTAYASDLIIHVLKEQQGVPMQHKYIIQALESVLDKKTGERMFTSGNINGAFNFLNKDLSKYNITKYRQNGGVYYKYTTDENELALNSEDINVTEQLLQSLNATFEIANKLKSELLMSNVTTTEEVIELIAKISDIELFVLRNHLN